MVTEVGGPDHGKKGNNVATQMRGPQHGREGRQCGESLLMTDVGGRKRC